MIGFCSESFPFPFPLFFFPFCLTEQFNLKYTCFQCFLPNPSKMTHLCNVSVKIKGMSLHIL